VGTRCAQTAYAAAAAGSSRSTPAPVSALMPMHGVPTASGSARSSCASASATAWRRAGRRRRVRRRGLDVRGTAPSHCLISCRRRSSAGAGSGRASRPWAAAGGRGRHLGARRGARQRVQLVERDQQAAALVHDAAGERELALRQAAAARRRATAPPPPGPPRPRPRPPAPGAPGSTSASPAAARARPPPRCAAAARACVGGARGAARVPGGGRARARAGGVDSCGARPASSRSRRALRTSPAVSTSCTARPPHSKLAATESRVRPGSGPVSQRARPSRRLASVDLPCAPRRPQRPAWRARAPTRCHSDFWTAGARAPRWAGPRWPS